MTMKIIQFIDTPRVEVDCSYTRVKAIQHLHFVVDHHVDAHGFGNVGLRLILLAKDDAVEDIVQPVQLENFLAFFCIVRKGFAYDDEFEIQSTEVHENIVYPRGQLC